ncbi:hypothetical protein ACXX82_11840 [Glaciimonas sp. GNP009]
MKRPLVIYERKPGSVAISPLVDAMLAENAFGRKTKTQRRLLRPLVTRVAFPFNTSITEIVERMLR